MSAMIIRLPTAATERVYGSDAVVEAPGPAELRRARIRIAQLEASLKDAMRDSLANFNRAREAERRLEELAR